LNRRDVLKAAGASALASTRFPRESTPAERAARDADVADEMDGVETLHEIDDARRKTRGVAWSVTEGECLLYHSHHRLTLDQVLAEELAEYLPTDTYHRAVWHGERLVAVIRPGPDGEAEVIRLDGADPVVIRDP